jgi:hypothetical protein
VNWVSQVFGDQPYAGLNAVTYGNGQFVAVGAGYFPDLLEAPIAIILTSTDGTNWVRQQSAADAGLHAITFASGQFVTVGRYGEPVESGQDTYDSILTSHNGVTWVQRPSPTQDVLSGIAYGNGHFLAVGWFPTILESDSIITLEVSPKPGAGLLALSVTGPTGLAYTIQSSTDLISWHDIIKITNTLPTTVISPPAPLDASKMFYRAYGE